MPEKKAKKKCLKNLLSRNLNRWYHFSLGEYGENSDRGNIFSWHLAYRCGFQMAVMKLQNHTIYCFCKGWVGVDPNFWTFAGETYKNRASVN